MVASWRRCGALWGRFGGCGGVVEALWRRCGGAVEPLWRRCGGVVKTRGGAVEAGAEALWRRRGGVVEVLGRRCGGVVEARVAVPQVPFKDSRGTANTDIFKALAFSDPLRATFPEEIPRSSPLEADPSRPQLCGSVERLFLTVFASLRAPFPEGIPRSELT